MVWGDLHAADVAYAFNATLLGQEAAWQSPIAIMTTTPSVTLVRGAEMFERRGVIVFSDGVLNLAAAGRLP